MISGIHGQFVEVTVVSCSKLKDTQLIGWQDPFLCIEYSNNKFRTKTCTDGGRNPTFNEKFQIPLIEGIHELTIIVWNSNTAFSNTFIGGGRVQLHKVLSEGYDDNPCMLQTHSGMYAGEAKLILHYANARNHHMPAAPSHVHGPPPGAYGAHTYQMHSHAQPTMYPPAGYPPAHQPYPPQPTMYAPSGYPPVHQPPSGYPPVHQPYPPQPAMYPPFGYSPVHQPYPPQPHRPEAYPPQPHMHYHPSPQHGQSYYPPGPSTGYYPPS